MRAGDIVILRSIYDRNVRWCCPNRYVGEWDGRHGLYCQPGNQAKVMHHDLERWASDAPPFDHTWERAHVLRFMRPGERHTVELMWDESWDFVGWYVNLQAPLTTNGRFFDTTDLALDVDVDQDGSWRWKDEDDLASLLRLGVLTEADAAEVRAEGERVIAERPWPTGWEDWRPPSDWRPLELPEDWHVV